MGIILYICSVSMYVLCVYKGVCMCVLMCILYVRIVHTHAGVYEYVLCVCVCEHSHVTVYVCQKGHATGQE